MDDLGVEGVTCYMDPLMRAVQAQLSACMATSLQHLASVPRGDFHP